MIETIKNLSNILFFVIVASVTVLSYFHARKTLFAPIRTETFKLQLKAFEDILLYFQHKTEFDFIETFDLNRIAKLNTFQMADQYVALFFPAEIKIDDAAKNERMKPLIGAVISREHMSKFFGSEDADTPVLRTVPEEKIITNPATILAKWQEYEHGIIGFTKEYQDQVKELERLAASPLLPKRVREYIGEFQGIARSNLTLIGETITECAKRMPEHFPNAPDMKEFSASWVWNEFNKKRAHFEPSAKRILDYLNSYLKVEDLMS